MNGMGGGLKAATVKLAGMPTLANAKGVAVAKKKKKGGKPPAMMKSPKSMGM